MIAQAPASSGSPPPHTPVLCRAVVAALAPRTGGVYADATFGAGGYSRALLAAADCTVYALDRDPEAIARGRSLPEAEAGRLCLIEGCFGDLDRLLAAQDALPLDGVAFDLGVSSPQLDTPERGFSFRFDGPLDMRMGRAGPSAAEVVNALPESELARLLRDYGEERKARRIARAIVEARQRQPLTQTGELAEVVRRAAGPAKAQDIDPATRTFQALRIHVNDELGELARGLRAAERALRAGGRLAVVAFHSLEDRLVKRFLRARSGEMPRASRHAPAPSASAQPAPSFRLLHRGARSADAAEAAANPRARSARLRAAERTVAPAWPADTPADPLAGGPA